MPPGLNEHFVTAWWNQTYFPIIQFVIKATGDFGAPVQWGDIWDKVFQRYEIGLDPKSEMVWVRPKAAAGDA